MPAVYQNAQGRQARIPDHTDPAAGLCGHDTTFLYRIRPTLLEGSVVTATRANLHWIVTEYGKFNVKGKSTWERAEMLIGISHPDFRDDMIREAEKMGIWSNTSKREY